MPEISFIELATPDLCLLEDSYSLLEKMRVCFFKECNNGLDNTK